MNPNRRAMYRIQACTCVNIISSMYRIGSCPTCLEKPVIIMVKHYKVDEIDVGKNTQLQSKLSLSHFPNSYKMSKLHHLRFFCSAHWSKGILSSSKACPEIWNIHRIGSAKPGYFIIEINFSYFLKICRFNLLQLTSYVKVNQLVCCHTIIFWKEIRIWNIVFKNSYQPKCRFFPFLW